MSLPALSHRADLPAGWTLLSYAGSLGPEIGYATTVRLTTPSGRVIAFLGSPGLVEHSVGEVEWSRYVPARDEADEDGTHWTAPVWPEHATEWLGYAIWEACEGDEGAESDAFGLECEAVARWLSRDAVLRGDWTYSLVVEVAARTQAVAA